MFQLVPQRVTETTIELFCGAFLGDEPPASARLTLSGKYPHDDVRLTLSDWHTLFGGESSTIHYARRTISGLLSGNSYEVELVHPDGSTLARARFETLPTHLPDNGNGSGPNRPFTVWLSSCFYSPKAPRGLEETVQSVVSDGRTRPHLKILAGDQVYLDYPQKKVILLSREDLRLHFNEVYASSWTHPAFADLLATGANYFLLDDHEFWDNYPDSPAALLWGIRRQAFWDEWRKLSLERAAALQSVKPTQRLEIGERDAPELSFFMAQTRLERSEGPYRILSDSSMNELEEWLNELRCPGVLALTQPVICRNGDASNRSMQDYRQFRERLYPALQRAKQDIVVLAGDPHFGRIAEVDLGGHRMIEIVASPLALVTPQVGGSAETPPTFPSYGAMAERARVAYPRLVPSYVSGSTRLSEEHGMLLSFFKTEGGVRLHVSLRLARQDTPADEWHWETTLRSR